MDGVQSAEPATPSGLVRDATVRAPRVSRPSTGSRIAVGRIDDAAEREADDLALVVVGRLASGAHRPWSATLRRPSMRSRITPFDTGADKDSGLHLARLGAAGADGGPLDDDTERRVRLARVGGSPLEGQVQRDMEGAFGADFGAVRIHRGPEAAALSERLQARAFTLGDDVFVGGDAPTFETPAGRNLLAHELTHTLQQRDGAGRIRRRVATPDEWAARSTATTLFGAYTFDRSPLLQQIDAALRSYDLVRQVVETGGLDAIEARRQAQNLCDRTLQLLEAIDAWQNDKLDDAGEVDSIRAASVAALRDEVFTEYDQLVQAALGTRAADQALWAGAGSGFSAPGAHDPANFQYLINGLTPTNEHAEQVQGNPALYNQNPGIISISIINQNKASVWALSGYILQIPPQNIFSANQQDQGAVAMKGGAHLDHLSAKFGLRPPGEILDATSPAQHNEITAIGSGYAGGKQGGGIVPIGIYVIEGDRAGEVMRFPQALKDANGVVHMRRDSIVVTMRPGLPAEWIARMAATGHQLHIPLVYVRQPPGAMVNGRPDWVQGGGEATVSFDDLEAGDRAAIREDLHPDTPIHP